jgi:hypothetical protein
MVLRWRLGGIRAQLQLGRQSESIGPTGHSQQQNTPQSKKVSRATMFMILYPIIYVVCTMPLAAARVYSLAGRTPSEHWLQVGGTLMASAGWLNCLLYSLTRQSFLASNSPTTSQPFRRSLSRSRYGTSAYGSGATTQSQSGIELTSAITTVPEKREGTPSPAGSTDRIVYASESKDLSNESGISNGVLKEMSWEVKTESIDSGSLHAAAAAASLGNHTCIGCGSMHASAASLGDPICIACH